MRLDKYLKVSRLIKRRTVANDACDGQRIMVNGRTAKASYDVKVGDVIEIRFGAKPYYPHQPMYLVADIGELTADTGFVPEIPFADGIRKILEIE